ncbi:DUF664 domain-containing protein [Auraticoccus sp. F435]|uniref:DUF664 domain-containing protein n=1 Tax=Auraticoccus cholistanensis TaxID=2656650 RepID=A0A6A9UR05_9ACTN|nr:DUF664 domain-containing protein [Auraticoccus cholistanensis]MVA75173.1 DUF664 domain-containing protein [Auraticoccus cholistanensis]
MTTAAETLRTAYDNIAAAVESAVDGLTPEQLATRPGPQANSIAWLVWHLTRVQDDHVSEVAGREQTWTTGWADRFALPFAPEETGYGMSTDDVAAVAGIGAELLLGYHRAVHQATDSFLTGLADDDLDRVVDESYDPPVTLGVRLVSVVTDDLMHAGQAAYVRGLLTAG